MIWLCACLVDGDLYRERRAHLTDDDGDHWTEAAGDCNDAEADVHPEAEEICNHTDDDCDGSVDEDMPTWFLDHDEDGAGDATTAVATCDRPGGFVDNDDDCNDDDPAIHPDAAETCNGYDDDCDNLIDGDDDAIEGGVALYSDDDDDGFGDDTTERLGCAGEKDVVEIGGDCDDTTEAVHPGAEPEICEDGVDTNCDGTGLGCTGSAATADALFYGEADGDEAGYVSASGVDLSGDGYTDLLIGARSNDDAGVDAGAAYVILGPTSTGERSLSTAWTQLTGDAAGDKAGRAVAFVGDVDADGFEDVAVAAPLNDSTSIDTGAVYLVSARDLFAGFASLETVAWGEIDGDHHSDYCGTALATAGDVNGDAVDDLWIGATGDDSGGDHDPGSAFLVLGPINSGLGTLDSQRHAELYGGGYDASNIGTVIASGDFDGDGASDVALGDLYFNTYGYRSGGVFLFVGPMSGDIPLASADGTIIAESVGDKLGTSVSSAGDFNGDGRDDLLVGAPTAKIMGEAYAILGAPSLGVLSDRATDLAAGTFQSGHLNVREVGSSVAMGEDFDNDGNSDVLIGAASSGKLAQGAAFLIAGPPSGTVTLNEAGPSLILRVDGEAAYDRLGSNVAFTGAVATGAAHGLLISSGTLKAASATASGGSYLFWNLEP